MDARITSRCRPRHCVLSRRTLFFSSFVSVALFIVVVIGYHQSCDSPRCITLRRVFPQTHALLSAPTVSSKPTPVWLPSIVAWRFEMDETLHVVTSAWSTRDPAYMAKSLTRLIKSVLIASRNSWFVFHVVANLEVMALVDTALWTGLCEVRRYDHSLSDGWFRLFAPLSAQRLFLHMLLPLSVKQVIYLDVDCIVMNDLTTLWRYFTVMPVSAWFAATRESEIIDSSYYLQASNVHVPFIPPVGVNAGVLLIQLERLRALPGYASTLEEIRARYADKLYVGDQDVLNIYGHWHPQEYYLLPCGWNVREDSYCQPRAPGDIAIVHGSRGIFDEKRHPLPHYFHEIAAVIDHHPYWSNDLWKYQYAEWRRRTPTFT